MRRLRAIGLTLPQIKNRMDFGSRRDDLAVVENQATGGELVVSQPLI
jgi:hypothetical protein